MALRIDLLLHSLGDMLHIMKTKICYVIIYNKEKYSWLKAIWGLGQAIWNVMYGTFWG